jgi:hypothetical protein
MDELNLAEVPDAEATKAFLDALPHEGDTLEEEAEAEEADSSSEEETLESDDSEEAPEEEKQKPLHKHPRFKELIKKNQDLKAELSGMNEKLDRVLSAQEVKAGSEIPKWFKAYVGDDEKAWEEYKEYSTTQQQASHGQIAEVVRKTLAEEKTVSGAKETQMQDWLSGQLQDLRDEGLAFDDQDLIDVLKEWQPTDTSGNLDFHRGYKLLKAMNNTQEGKEKAKKKSTARKKAAARTSSGSGGESPKSGTDMKLIKTYSMEELANMD